MKDILTLRQLIVTVEETDDWKDKLFEYLYNKDNGYVGKTVKFESTVKSYTHVIEELKKKKKTKPFKYSISVERKRDSIDEKFFIDVSLLNPDYVAPEKGLKPWGGKNPPKGYYNCNADKHNERFAFGYTSWSKLIDTTVTVWTDKLKWWEVLAEILWELTFNGFTEKDCEKFNSMLEKRLDESLKDIKSGNYRTFSPDELNDEFDKILKKKKK